MVGFWGPRKFQPPEEVCAHGGWPGLPRPRWAGAGVAVRERRGQGAEHRSGNPHALRCIAIGIKRVSWLALSRDNVRASPGRVRRRPEGRPSLISKSKAENLFGQFGERPAIEKPIEGQGCEGPSPDARSARTSGDVAPAQWQRDSREERNGPTSSSRLKHPVELSALENHISSGALPPPPHGPW